MTLNLIFGLMVFAVTFVVAAGRSVATAFAFCFIPALLFCRPVVGYMLNGGLPEMRISNAAILGLLGGMFFHWGRQAKIRWNPVDGIILLAPLVAIASAIDTETWHTGYNELLKQLFAWSAPYFFARYAFRDEKFRRNLLWVLIVSCLVLAFFAAIEFRFYPHFYAIKFGGVGLKVAYNQQAVARGHFFRAETSFQHPIFFGDGCVSLGCLMLMLASTLKEGWMRLSVVLAVGAIGFALLTSISFGPYLAMAIACGTFFMFRFVRISHYYVLFAGMLLVIVGLVTFTAHLAKTEIPTRPRDGTIYDSFLVRWEIVQKCAPLATEAGLLGNGKPKIAEVDAKGKPILDLESVDNAYMLFLVVRGYIYAGLWALIPLAVVFRVSTALLRNRRKEFVFPLAIGAGSSVGISFAFYVVWAGWNPEPYTILWLIATAFTMSACDMCFDRIKAEAGAPLPVQPQAGATSFPQIPGMRYPFPGGARTQH